SRNPVCACPKHRTGSPILPLSFRDLFPESSNTACHHHHGGTCSLMPYYTYILANKRNGTLYVGVTNDIARRVWEHRQGEGGHFTRKYGIHRLVYVEIHEDVTIAIQREKTIKDWSRKWKPNQIERDNPDWDDLYESLL